MSERELDKDDMKHIVRLQAMRQTGRWNMFTELKEGLTTHLGDEEGMETYEWVKDNWEFFESADWTEK